MNMSTVFIIYLILINVITFITFGVDKSRARKNRWRISEATLLILALIGGSIGAELGMYGFHHKTKHPRFFIGIPLIMILQIILIFWIMG